MQKKTYIPILNVSSLLKESKTPTVETTTTMSTISTTTSTTKENVEGRTSVSAVDNITVEERQLLGRYGVWLLVGRCTPIDNTPAEVLGRLLAMLFHWFHMTAYSYDGKENYVKNLCFYLAFCTGQEESTLEKLKTENVCGWLRDISKTHYTLFISCLLPHPPEYARIGGHW